MSDLKSIVERGINMLAMAGYEAKQGSMNPIEEWLYDAEQALAQPADVRGAGDGEDHLESMVNSLPVVIRADQLRELMAPSASVPDRLIELATAEISDAAASAQEGAAYEPEEWATLALSMATPPQPAGDEADLICDLAAALYAAVHAGKLNEADVINQNGDREQLGEILDRAEAFLATANQSSGDGMCSPEGPSLRCVCREEIGHRVCAPQDQEKALNE